MEICLLCNEEHRKENLLSKELGNDFTIEDGIKQYFVTHRQLLTNPPSSSICMICFKTLKYFYEFTSQIDSRFPPQTDVIQDDEKSLEQTKVEELEKPDAEEPDTQFEIDDDYSESYIEEHLDEDFIEPQDLPQDVDIKKSIRDVKEHSMDIKESSLDAKESSIVVIVPSIDVKEPQTSPKLPQVEYPKITTRKVGRKPKTTFSNDFFAPPYKVRRAHPKNDLEGDQKIKNLVDMKCHECGEEFDKFLEVSRHFREVHPDIPAYLICCNKKFTKRATLLDHVEYHDRSAIYRCELCEKEFRSKAILRQHQRKFHVEPQDPVMCGDCGKFFSNKYTLKTHMKSHIVDTAREYECYICKKPFKNHAKLLDHFKYRHDPAHNRLSVCHFCSKAVTRLDIHISMVHASEPVARVRCEICGHNLKITSLKGHMRKHQDSSGYICKICNQFLKNKSTLNCHIKRVHGEGKFKCEYCGKKYHQKGHLHDHIACQHTGDFLHKCRVEGCNKEFRNVGRRGLHEKRMHRVEYETRFKPLYLRDNVETVEYVDEGDSQDGIVEEDQVVTEFIVKYQDE